MEIFTAKVPITYTKTIEEEGVTMSNTIIVGYMFTANLLASMQEQRRKVEELLKK